MELLLELLKSYDFTVVAIGTILLSIASAFVGCMSLHKGQSLIGDTVGHSTFPGIILAYMLSQSRNPLILSIGAAIAGGVAYSFVLGMNRTSKIRLDACLAIILTGFFGLGMVLKSYIQGNKNYANASQSGLQNYIFGQAAYIRKDDVFLILGAAIIVLILFYIFYKELKLFVFDEQYAKSLGFRTSYLNLLLLLMVIILLSVGLKLVGAILISSFLILPAVTANQWSCHLGKVLLISGVSAGVSAFIGTVISSVEVGMSTGPTIILVMGTFAFLSMVIGPYGFRNLKR